MGIRIYMFDNGTGREIPEKVGTIDTEVLLGSTLTEVHKSIEPDSQLLCSFTHLADGDFIVPTELDKRILKTVLNFGKYKYKVDIKPTSVWYSDKAEKNIIISDSVKMGAVDLGVMLAMYLNEINLKKKADGRAKATEIFRVVNTRNSHEIMITPNKVEAMKICDKNPCCVIMDKDKNIIYKSKYGRTSIPYEQRKNHMSKYKASQSENNGVFDFKSM